MITLNTGTGAIVEMPYSEFVDMIHIATQAGNFEYAQQLELVLKDKRDTLIWG